MYLRGPASWSLPAHLNKSALLRCCLVGGSCPALVSDTREVRQVRSLQTEAGSKLLWPESAGLVPFAMQALRLGPLAEAVEAVVACETFVQAARVLHERPSSSTATLQGTGRRSSWNRPTYAAQATAACRFRDSNQL